MVRLKMGRYRSVQAAAAYVALRTYTDLLGIRLRLSPGS